MLLALLGLMILAIWAIWITAWIVAAIYSVSWLVLKIDANSKLSTAIMDGIDGLLAWAGLVPGDFILIVVIGAIFLWAFGGFMKGWKEE